MEGDWEWPFLLMFIERTLDGRLCCDCVVATRNTINYHRDKVPIQRMKYNFRHSSLIFGLQARVGLLIMLLAVLSGADRRAVAQTSGSAHSGATPSGTPVFKSQSELVLVPVVVQDKRGTPVTGLTNDDFVVQENKESRKIEVFEQVVTTPTTHLTRTAPPGVFTNVVQRDRVQTPRLNIVVLDTINTPFLDQTRARQALLEMLAKSVDRHEVMTLLTLSRSGFTVVHDFTTDTGILIAALQGVRGATSMARMTMAGVQMNSELLQTMGAFADMTGGRAFYNTNDLEHAFESADDDSNTYYLLGYYRAPNDNVAGWRKLKVKVLKNGVKVRSRSGYFVRPDDIDGANPQKAARHSSACASDSACHDLQLALASPIDYTAIPMALKWEGLSPGKDGKKAAPFLLQLSLKSLYVDAADANHVTFEIVALARNENGRGEEPRIVEEKTIDIHLQAKTMQALADKGLNFNGEVDLAPGDYSVRVVVRDDLSGRIGSLQAPLSVK